MRDPQSSELPHYILRSYSVHVTDMFGCLESKWDPKPGESKGQLLPFEGERSSRTQPAVKLQCFAGLDSCNNLPGYGLC